MSRSDVLVDADWVEAHLDDDNVVLVEVDEDTSAYDKGHIPGAVKIDWREDIQEPVRRDFIDQEGSTATTTSACSTLAARSWSSTPVSWSRRFPSGPRPTTGPSPRTPLSVPSVMRS